MGRLIFFLLLAAVAYAAWRWLQGQQRLGGGRDDQRARRDQRSEEMMVRCDVCGLNVPQSEALSENGRWFCGEEHRRKRNAS